MNASDETYPSMSHMSSRATYDSAPPFTVSQRSARAALPALTGGRDPKYAPSSAGMKRGRGFCIFPHHGFFQTEPGPSSSNFRQLEDTTTFAPALPISSNKRSTHAGVGPYSAGSCVM